MTVDEQKQFLFASDDNLNPLSSGFYPPQFKAENEKKTKILKDSLKLNILLLVVSL